MLSAIYDDEHHEVHAEVRSPIEVVLARIVSYVFGVIVAFIAIRFLLKLFAANAGAGFVRFIYGVSDIFMAPFQAVFKTQQVNGSVFEWSDLLAIVVYLLIAWGLIALIRAVSPREHAGTYEEERQEDVHRLR
jgi:predicted membrane channel-forming protein YqfA (hemolysin III family)